MQASATTSRIENIFTGQLEITVLESFASKCESRWSLAVKSASLSGHTPTFAYIMPLYGRKMSFGTSPTRLQLYKARTYEDR